MLPRRLKFGLATFAALSLALAANVLYLQPGSPARPGSEPTAQMLSVNVRAAAAPARDPIADKLAAEAPAAAAAAQPADAPATADGAEAIRAVQRELHQRGYDAGTPDGVPGLITRAAVLAYEWDHGLALTAEPSDRLLRQIRTGAGQPGAKPPATTAGNPHAEQVIRTVQQSLANAGYAVGKVDGRPGEETVRAIREFEIDQGLPETGRVSGQLVARLARLAGQGRLTSAR